MTGPLWDAYKKSLIGFKLPATSGLVTSVEKVIPHHVSTHFREAEHLGLTVVPK